MPRRCSVPGCRSNYRDKSAAGKYVSCYGFPSDAKTLEKWLDAIGRRNFVPNYDNAVCAKHFDDSSFVCEDMYRGANGELKVFKFAKPKLRNEAVPSKFLQGKSEREKQIERNDGFGVSEGVKTRSSTLNNLFNQDDAVLRNNAFLKAEDRKSCLDFVDVEMKSPETEEKPLNLSEYECLDLRKKCGPLEKNGLLGNETVVFNGGGEGQQNFDAVSFEVGGKLLGKRGVDDRSHFDSTTNCEFGSQQIHCGEPDSDSGSFVKRVKFCEELNRQNPFRHAAALKLDRPDEGNLKRRSDGNHEAMNLNNSSNVETSSAVLSGEIGVVAKKEKSVSGEAVESLVVKDVVRSDSVGKNYEVHDDSGADIRYEDHRSEKKFKKFQTDCVDLGSGGGDSDGGSLCGKFNCGENLENENITRVEENASLVLEKDVKSDQKRPCLASETDVDAKISNTGKNRVSQRNIKKKDNGCCEDKAVVLKKRAVIVPGNGDLVLTGTCNDDRGFIISKNRGLVKNTKKVNSTDNTGRNTDSSFGNVEAEIDNKSRATSGPEIGDGDGRNSSPDDAVGSVQRISVNSKKKPQKNLGDINSNQRQNSGFSFTTKNQCGATLGQENGEFVSTGTKYSPNEDGQLGQVIFVKNMEQLLKGFDDINNKSECPGDVSKSESSVFKQEKLNLLNQDNKSRQVDFEKNSKKLQGDLGHRCSGSGFAISVNEKGTTPNQEINNLLVIDANFIQNYVPAEEVASVKNCEKFQRNLGVACSSAVSKNGKRAVSSQERCNLVLMDAKLGLDNNVKCGQVVSVKNLKIDQRHFGDTRSANGLDGVKMDEKIAAPCQANVKFMLTDENLELNDGIKSGQVVSMKNLKHILRNFGGSTSDFCDVTKNEDMGSKRAASNRNLFTNQKHFGDSGCGGSELNNGVNFVHVETVNNSAKIRRNVDMCSPDPRGFVDVTKNEKRNISDIEKDNLALLDANLELNGDSKSGQVVSVKNLKKVREIFDDTDSPSVIGGFTMNERISGQENGNSVLMDANLELKGDSKSGEMVSEKNLTKNKKLFDDSSCGFGEGTINERRADPGQENSVVMDANSALNGDIRSGKNLKMVRRNFEDASLPPPSGFGVVTKNERRAISGQENGNLVLMDANLIPSYGTGPVGEPEVKVDGQICGSEKTGEDEGPSEAQEWEGWAVKEELFRGLGLVPRGVLHDRSVDRRHCVSGSRRSESAKGKTAVFYPPGTAMFDTERFIGEIQRRPAIYDVRSKVYSNRVAKLKYWHEVGQEMYKGWDALDQMERRTLVKELQIKWKSIRDHFMRQLKQNMNGEGPKKKKYVHFDQLQFLTANLGVKRPRHSFKPTKQEPEEEYMELTPELPEERHFSFMSSVGRPDYDEHEVPVAATLLPQQPEDLSYNTKDLSYHHHKELSYHKELEGDRMGNKMFLLSLLPIMERLPDHSNIRARLQLMEVLQTFVAHEDASHRDFYNYHDEKQSCGEASQQHSTASHSDSDS